MKFKISWNMNLNTTKATFKSNATKPKKKKNY